MTKSFFSFSRSLPLYLGILLSFGLALTAQNTAHAEDEAAPAKAEEPKKKPAAVDPKFAAQMEAFLADDNNVQTLASAIEGYFKKKQMEAAKQRQEQELLALEEQFKNPVKVDIGNSPVTGKADAKITIVEFSDFQCPYCSQGYLTMKKVLAAYPNDVKVAFKHLPLDFHPNAKPAAIASLAAKEQGKFWEMHDALFQNQQKLGTELYLQLAQQIGLDVEKFKTDLTREDLAKIVDEDAKLGASLGIQGTPGFFVNGVAVKGAYPEEYFKKLIDRWLKQLK